MTKRRAEGRSDKAIIRCLKRHIARAVHRAITTDIGTSPPIEQPDATAA